MLDEPDTDALLGSVIAFLRDRAIPALPSREAFHARIAANALDTVRRALILGPASEAAERSRLTDLLGHGGPLSELNAEFALGLREGRFEATAPSVLKHLWATTLAKLAVDQPGYPAFVRSSAEYDAARSSGEI